MMGDKTNVVQLWNLLEKAAFTESIETLARPGAALVYHRLPAEILTLAESGNAEAVALREALDLPGALVMTIRAEISRIRENRELSGQGQEAALRRLGEKTLAELDALWARSAQGWGSLEHDRGQYLGKRNTWHEKLIAEKDVITFLRRKELREILLAKGLPEAGVVVRDAARAGRAETIAAVLTAVPESDPIVSGEVLERAVFDLFATVEPTAAAWLVAYDVVLDGLRKATVTLREFINKECQLAARPGGPGDPAKDAWSGVNLTARSEAARAERLLREIAEAEKAVAHSKPAQAGT